MNFLPILKLTSPLLLAAGVVAGSAGQTLHVYGPGGPKGPFEECAQQFGKQTGIKVVVTAGPESGWMAQALQDADLVYGGAEYMLTQTGLAHPGFFDEGTRVSLYARPSGVLVRPGNPKKIRRLEDLAALGVKLIDVNGAGQLGMWEDAAKTAELMNGIRKNIRLSVTSSAEAVSQWKAHPDDFDAWFTFASWHYRLPQDTELAPIPANQLVTRGTPVVITARTQQAKAARQFLTFLQSEAGHAIVKKWGWL
jgi:accessory colonization factor AcfC